jgi:hypothetical protein
MLTLAEYVLILWGVIALGWFGAWWLEKRRPQPRTGEFTDAAVFLGVTFGLLLGLLQVFVTNHYSDVRSRAETEATTLVALFDDLNVFQTQSPTARQDVVCYMQSIVDQDWKAQERGRVTEAPDTAARGDRLRNLKITLPVDSLREQGAYTRVTQEISDAGAARQELLSLASPQIPTVLWVLVYVSALVMMFLIVGEYRSRPRIIRQAVVASVFVLLTFEIGSLVTLDRPFSPVARIGPDAMSRAVTLVKSGEPPGAFEHCGPPLTQR